MWSNNVCSLFSADASVIFRVSFWVCLHQASSSSWLWRINNCLLMFWLKLDLNILLLSYLCIRIQSHSCFSVVDNRLQGGWSKCLLELCCSLTEKKNVTSLFHFQQNHLLLNFCKCTSVRTHNSLTVFVPSQDVFFSDHIQMMTFVTWWKFHCWLCL